MKSVPLAIAIALAASLHARAQAGVPTIQEGDVPKQVIDAVKRKYPDAKMTRFERETEGNASVFEISLQDASKKWQVEVSPEGRLLEEEVPIAASDLPSEVKKGLASSQYANWKIERAERLVLEEKRDAPNYEVLVANGQSRTELVLDAAGAITKERPMRKGEQTD